MSVPASLTNVLVSQGNGEVLISWSFQSGATSYDVQRSTDLNTWASLTPPPTTPSFLDDTAVEGTLYYYQVAGVNGDGTGAYSTPQAVVPTYPGKMSLGQLRLASQQKADRVGSDFITTSEWNEYINQSYFELYDILVQKYGNDYFVDELEITTDNSPVLALPNGVNHDGARPIYKLLGVDLNVGGTGQGNEDGWVTLRKFEFISRNNYVYAQVPTRIANMRYRLSGNDIRFSPTPTAGQGIKLWYVPRMRTLLADNDIADGVSGWLEYVVIDAAIKALTKEESDTTALMTAKQWMLDRIEAAAENRDAGEPETISDTRGAEYNGTRGFGGGWEF